MAVIEKFLGKKVLIPEDRRYCIEKSLWGLKAGPSIVFGLTQPALILLGGVKDIERLFEEGQQVQPGDSVAFAITGKILYIETPFAGAIHYNGGADEFPECVNTDPYGKGWLFEIKPSAGAEELYRSLASFERYLESLRTSEGFKNPDGLKGGVSGICKAVYSGIGQQKL